MRNTWMFKQQSRHYYGNAVSPSPLPLGQYWGTSNIWLPKRHWGGFCASTRRNVWRCTGLLHKTCQTKTAWCAHPLSGGQHCAPATRRGTRCACAAARHTEAPPPPDHLVRTFDTLNSRTSRSGPCAWHGAWITDSLFQRCTDLISMSELRESRDRGHAWTQPNRMHRYATVCGACIWPPGGPCVHTWQCCSSPLLRSLRPGEQRNGALFVAGSVPSAAMSQVGEPIGK